MYGNHMIRSNNKQPTRSFSFILKYNFFNLNSRSTTENHSIIGWDTWPLSGHNKSFCGSEHLKLYNKAIVGLPESDRYDIIRSKWTDFYQELENAVSTFGFKAVVLIVTSIDALHVPTEVKDNILSCLYIAKFMVDSHCKILWDDNSGAGLGRHPTANHGEVLDNPESQAVISQQLRRSYIIGLFMKNYITTDAKRKLRAFRSEYTFNTQDDGSEMLFVVLKMVQPDTCAGCSGIKCKLENMKMSQFKHDIPKSNLHI